MNADNNVVKCPHCQKIYFSIGSDICPFCKNMYDNIDRFKEMFGEDNPFRDIFGGNI